MLLFFGAGKIGRRILNEYRQQGFAPAYFVDNDLKRKGERFEGIEIVTLDDIDCLDRTYFLITCKDTQSIYDQLIEHKIDEKHILQREVLDRYLLLHEIWAEDVLTLCEAFYVRNNFCSFKEEWPIGRVFFDFQQGDVLGGVETWSNRMMCFLNSRGYVTKKMLNYKETDLTFPCSVVSNFPQENFYKACLEKARRPGEIRHITIIFNDEDFYYDRYALLSEYIDFCFVISSKMTEELKKRGFPVSKIRMMQYHVAIKDTLERKYSKAGERLRIGYAGRVVKHQKRVERLIELAEELRERGCDFRFEIAGEGKELDSIKVMIAEKNLSDKVFCLGRLNETDMMEFWGRQDIKISCSDYEGHSISQVEAMAAGAVPIITDVSGARDDVNDGINGYVVDVGDIKTMADRIMLLDADRNKMEQMGEKAYQTIMSHEKEPNIIEELFPVLNE